MSTHKKSELLSAIWVDDEIYHKIKVDVEKKKNPLIILKPYCGRDWLVVYVNIIFFHDT